jgi:hypothetical protein
MHLEILLWLILFSVFTDDVVQTIEPLGGNFLACFSTYKLKQHPSPPNVCAFKEHFIA